jgi:transposase
MIPQGVQVFALDPVDMRCSCDRLSGIAKEQVGYESRSGALFVFYGRRRDALKILFFDGSGMCIFYNGWTEIPSACPSPEPKARGTSRSMTPRSRRCSMASRWRPRPAHAYGVPGCTDD